MLHAWVLLKFNFYKPEHQLTISMKIATAKQSDIHVVCCPSLYRQITWLLGFNWKALW